MYLDRNTTMSMIGALGYYLQAPIHEREAAIHVLQQRLRNRDGDVIPQNNDNAARALLSWVYHGRGVSADEATEALQALYEQCINVGDDEDHAGEPLLDRLAMMFRDVVASNRMSLRTFKAMQRAILLPSELAALDQATRTFTCTSCQEPFTDGEMGTVTITEGLVTIRCIRCRVPNQVRGGCGHTRALSAKLQQIINKWTRGPECAECGQAPEIPVVGPQIAQTDGGITNTANGYWTTLPATNATLETLMNAMNRRPR